MFGFLKKWFETRTPPPEITPDRQAVDDYYFRIREVAVGHYDDLPDEAKLAENSRRVEVACLPGNGPAVGLDLREIPEGLDRLATPNTVIVATGRIQVLIEYPLTRVAVAEVLTDRPEGFTLAAILASVRDIYADIYAQEEASQSEPTPSVAERGPSLKRPPSDGTFGISSHDLDELGISSVHVITTSEGIWIRPEVVS